MDKKGLQALIFFSMLGLAGTVFYTHNQKIVSAALITANIPTIKIPEAPIAIPNPDANSSRANKKPPKKAEPPMSAKKFAEYQQAISKTAEMVSLPNVQNLATEMGL